MTAAASERLPPSHAAAGSRIGHVATAIMMDQIDAIRNGRTIQKLLTSSVPSANSCRVVRARSSGRLDCMPLTARGRNGVFVRVFGPGILPLHASPACPGGGRLVHRLELGINDRAMEGASVIHGRNRPARGAP